MSRHEILTSTTSHSGGSVVRCEYLRPLGGVYECAKIPGNLPDLNNRPLRPDNCPLKDKTNFACEVVFETQTSFGINGASEKL